MSLGSNEAAPAGWRLTVPVVNLSGPNRAGGTFVAAIGDREAARKAIPFGRAVPSAPLSPLTADEVRTLGLVDGEVRKIA